MTILQMSFWGSVMILLTLLLRLSAGNKLPRRAFMALWGMAVLRLILPFSLPIELPVLQKNLPDIAVSQPTGQPLAAPTLAPGQPAPGSPASDLSVSGQPAPAQLASGSLNLWAVVWGVGVLFCGLWFLYSYIRCVREFRTALPAEQEKAARWLADHPLRRKLSIRQSDRITAPLTYGLLRPVILLPAGLDWESESLSYVLAHEYLHIRRLDGLYKLLLAAAASLHWFNPLVWVMLILAGRDMELACDEGVVRLFGLESRGDYARTLLNMEERRSTPIFSAFSKSPLGERVSAIMQLKPAVRSRRLLAGLAAAAAAALLLLSGVRAAETPAGGKPFAGDRPSDGGKPSVGALAGRAQTLILSGQISRYEDQSPYIAFQLYNGTGRTVTSITCGMAAYDENGEALALQWNLLDSSDKPAFSHLTEQKLQLLPGEVFESEGGWSLYDSKTMPDWPSAGEDGGRAVYPLLCLKTVTFADGGVWENDDYAAWEKAAGEKKTPAELKAAASAEYQILPGETAVTAVTAEEKEKILALQLPDYQKMTIEDFRQQVNERTDSPEYRALLDRVSANEAFYAQKDWDETADFYFNLLEPLTAERWRERDFSGGVLLGDFSDGSRLSLEYTFSLKITDAALTVGEYDAARRGMADGFEQILLGESETDAAIKAAVQALKARWSQPGRLEIAADYVYRIEDADAVPDETNTSQPDTDETREYPPASRADYDSLLALRTAGFEQQSLRVFNQRLLDWANENYERQERIFCDIAYNDYQVQLSAEEKDFAAFTACFSGMENGEYVRSLYTGAPEDDPYASFYLPEKGDIESGRAAWCSLWVQYSYHVADKDTVTVGERDAAVKGLISEIEKFWQNEDLETLLKLSKAQVSEKLSQIAALCSSDGVKLSIAAVSFETMPAEPAQ